MQAKQAAEDSSKKASAVGEALEEIWDWFWKFPPLAAVLLGAKKVQHLVVARRTEGKSHLLLGLALLTKVAGHLQRAERATQAADVFKELEGQISKAESAVGRHVEFWQVLNNKIQVAVLDPGRLLNAENGPKVAIVKKQRDAWIAISRMFEDYGSQVRRLFPDKHSALIAPSVESPCPRYPSRCLRFCNSTWTQLCHVHSYRALYTESNDMYFNIRKHKFRTPHMMYATISRHE